MATILQMQYYNYNSMTVISQLQYYYDLLRLQYHGYYTTAAIPRLPYYRYGTATKILWYYGNNTTTIQQLRYCSCNTIVLQRQYHGYNATATIPQLQYFGYNTLSNPGETPLKQTCCRSCVWSPTPGSSPMSSTTRTFWS